MRNKRKQRLLMKSKNKSIKVNHPVIKKQKVEIPKFTQQVVQDFLSEKSMSLLKSHSRNESNKQGILSFILKKNEKNKNSSFLEKNPKGILSTSMTSNQFEMMLEKQEESRLMYFANKDNFELIKKPQKNGYLFAKKLSLKIYEHDKNYSLSTVDLKKLSKHNYSSSKIERNLNPKILKRKQTTLVRQKTKNIGLGIPIKLNRPDIKNKRKNYLMQTFMPTQVKRRRLLQKVKNAVEKMIKFGLDFEQALKLKLAGRQPYCSPSSYSYLTYFRKGQLKQALLLLRCSWTLIFEFDKVIFFHFFL